MIDNALFKQLPPEATVARDAALREYTTFQLGGPCPALVDCPDAQTLEKAARLFIRHGIPFLVIGQGSNLLVADEGIEQAVLRFCTADTAALKTAGNRMTAPGGLLLDEVARVATERQIGDLAFCSGIPGTLGGAIAGNAGAFGRQIGDVVESVRLLDREGGVREVPGSELDFGYRDSRLKRSGEIVLETTLRLETADFQALEKQRAEILQLRREKHPDWRTAPCAGSVFRNIEPTSSAGRREAAGWFLEQAGARDLRVGRAHLFEKHANIVVADPGATAREAFELTERMADAVEEKFGFRMEREIRLVGAFGQ